MLTFNEYLKNETGNPPAAPLKKKAHFSQSVMQNLARTKLVPPHLAEQIAAGECPHAAGDIANNLSNEILNLNRLIVTDPSCAVAVKRLSEMVLLLHFLMLMSSVDGDRGATRTGNA